MVRVTVTGSSDTWWRAFQEHRLGGNIPVVLTRIADGTDGEVILSETDWRAVHRFGASLPGWVETDGAEQLGAEPFDE